MQAKKLPQRGKSLVKLIARHILNEYLPGVCAREMNRSVAPWVLLILAGAFYFIPLTTGTKAGSEEPALDFVQQGAHDEIILTRPSYDYAPAVIRDGTVYRLYWCAGVAGDFILYAEASDPRGPWHSSQIQTANTFDVALRPTGSSANFDGLHTCDPSVIKISDRYYMYYGGSSADGALTAIGLAASSDGIHFNRMNGGEPIITAARTNPKYELNHLTYGAGQPAVLYWGSYFYLSFTDSTGAGVNPGNGAGQFLMRSKDPTFQTGLQEWTGTGWADRAAGQHTAEYSYLESFGIDWMLDVKTNQIILATDRIAGEVSLYLLDPDTFAVRGASKLPTQWREGPALIAQADRTALPRLTCDALQIEVVVAEGPKPSRTWDLALSSGNFKISPCADTLK